MAEQELLLCVHGEKVGETRGRNYSNMQPLSSQPSGEAESLDPNKAAGLGRKMKAISLTMRRKMCKKHSKSFTEETVSHRYHLLSSNLFFSRISSVHRF